MAACPCGIDQEYETCCGPYIEGSANPPTAEAVMRSRYVAFTKSNVKYIVDSCHPSTRDTIDQANIREWASKSDWKGFDIVKIQDGGENDDKGFVEFIAKYDNSGEHHLHHELSEFRKHDGKWYFYDGELVTSSDPIVNESPKVGRNDPCPCGSGKKYKKCCGK